MKINEFPDLFGLPSATAKVFLSLERTRVESYVVLSVITVYSLDFVFSNITLL